MTKRLSRTILAVVLIFALSITAYAVPAGAGTEQYTNTSVLTDGLTYTNTIYSNDTYGREESFLLELSRNSSVQPMVMACDTIYGGLTISQCVAWAESQGYHVVAAVNTDFFNSSRVPLGMVVENGIYKSSPSGQNAVAFQPDGRVTVSEAPSVEITLTNHGSDTDAANDGKTVSFESFNKMRTASGGLYLYSEAFSTVSTRTTGDGWFVRFRILDGEMTASGTVELEVTECTETSGAVPIGAGNLVLTAAASGGLRAEYEKFAVGDKVTLQTVCSDPVLAAAEQVTGCGDILVSGGQVTDSAAWDGELTDVHPRTVLGVKSDGTLVLYVVDGRQSNYSGGVSLTMLAEELKALDCVTVVNLDGGGSSAMSVRLPGYDTCKTVNRPSDGKERSCGAYLLLVTEETGGRADRLHIVEDGNLLLAGSTMNLHTVATDRAVTTVQTPSDVTVTAKLGTVSDGKYHAPAAGGIDTITLRSPSTGTTGTGTVHVVDQVSGLTVKDDSGKTVTSLRLKPGQTVQLTPSVYQYGRAVLSTLDAYTYTVTGDAGTVSDTGLFTAGENYGATGTIVVSGGGQSVTVSVSIPAVFTDVAGTWCEEYVTRLQNLGIVNGTSATTFSPNDKLRRGDFMVMLYNAAGRPEVTGSGGFADVADTDYFAAAVNWAARNGIALGTGDGNFAPSAYLTREQAFTFLYRALPALGVTAPDGAESLLDAFADAGEVADYARIPAATLIAHNIVGGADGKLTPRDDLTRAQMAKMVCTALDLVEG